MQIYKLNPSPDPTFVERYDKYVDTDRLWTLSELQKVTDAFPRADGHFELVCQFDVNCNKITTPSQLASLCDEVIGWLNSDDVRFKRWTSETRTPAGIRGGVNVDSEGLISGAELRLRVLVESAVSLPVDEVPPVLPKHVSDLTDRITAIALTKKLKKWATDLGE